jgi:hypothetical protein
MAKKPVAEPDAIQELVNHQVRNMYLPLVGDPDADPRFLDRPDKDATVIELKEGEPAQTDVWEEVFIQHSRTPTYILRYRKGDVVPAVWGLPPFGSFDFTPDFRDQPWTTEGAVTHVRDPEYFERERDFGAKS